MERTVDVDQKTVLYFYNKYYNYAMIKNETLCKKCIKDIKMCYNTIY